MEVPNGDENGSTAKIAEAKTTTTSNDDAKNTVMKVEEVDHNKEVELPTIINSTKDSTADSTVSKEIINDTKEPVVTTIKKELTENHHKPRNNHTTYSLKLKSEFILTERSPTLPTLPPIPKIEQSDDRDNNTNKKKKNRGRNKKRPRDAKPDPSTKMCFEYLQNKEKGCAHGDTCKFSHDLQGAFKTREKDISEISKCPNYDNFGYCPFSVLCRVGSEHLDSDGNNLQKTVDKDGTDLKSKTDCYKNVLDKNVLIQLRKNKFPFQMQRKSVQTKNQKLKKQGEDTSNCDVAATPIPMGVLDDASTPYPSKTVKLIDFRNKVYIAPLTTVGNLPFRRIMKHYQADITCGEMTVASSLLMGHTSEWALLKRHASEDVFGVQIAGGHPDQYVRCCEILQSQSDYLQYDFLDMNLGCPLDMICEKGAGAKLMTKSNKLKDILVGMGKVLGDKPISIKMRTGWDEKKPFAKELIEKIVGWDIPNVTTFYVHGRSRLQRYTKLADWEYLNSVASTNPTKPVIPNGDILSYTDFHDKIDKYPSLTPCAMLGRGALIKPWLPVEIKEKRHWDISSSERLDMLKLFVSNGLEHWGSDTQGVNTTRRFLLEWLSFLYRYIPIGMLEVLPQEMNQRPPVHMCGRDDLETLMLSNNYNDWVKISEMLLGPVPDGFEFQPKHKANSYS